MLEGLVEVVVDRLVVRELEHPAVKIAHYGGVALVLGGELAQSIGQRRRVARRLDQKSMATLVQSSW